MSIQPISKNVEARQSLTDRIPVNSVWKWKRTNQFPVIIRGVNNLIDTNVYPATVVFETVKGEVLSLNVRDFENALANTGFGPNKFASLRKTLAELA